jgi:hypothetical protein
MKARYIFGFALIIFALALVADFFGKPDPRAVCEQACIIGDPHGYAMSACWHKCQVAHP